MEFSKIVGLCLLAAVGYGIAHDMVTAHLCVEYFTVAHPFVFPSDSPIDMALIWGVLATWWVGLGLGLLLAVAARAGGRPGLTARELVRPLGRLLLVMAGAAAGSWLVGFGLGQAGWLEMSPWLAERIPATRHALFFGDALAHLASYAVALFGGLFLIGSTWRRRRKVSLNPTPSQRDSWP